MTLERMAKNLMTTNFETHLVNADGMISQIDSCPKLGRIPRFPMISIIGKGNDRTSILQSNSRISLRKRAKRA